MTNILGIDVLDIPEDYTPMGIYALIECLNGEGEQVFVVRHSGMDGLRRYGAIQVLHENERQCWVDGFESTGDDE